MVRRLCILAVVFVGSLALGGTASAQINLYNRPTVSPYLNLLSGPNAFGVNTSYQNLVEPLVDGRKAALANRDDITRLQRQVQGGRGGRGPAGTAGRFMNYSHYYSGIR